MGHFQTLNKCVLPRHFPDVLSKHARRILPRFLLHRGTAVELVSLVAGSRGAMVAPHPLFPSSFSSSRRGPFCASSPGEDVLKFRADRAVTPGV